MPKFSSVREVFAAMPASFRPEKADGARALVQFALSGEDAGRYWVQVQDGACRTGEGDAPGTPDATVAASARDWLRITNGELNPIVASVMGRVKIDGDMSAALKIAGAFPRG